MQLNQLLKIQKDIYQGVSSILDGNLELFSFVGSSSTRTFVEGWSDIDILIVISNYVDDQVLRVYNFVKTVSNVKVGISLFSTEEINKNRVDNKNAINLHLIQTGKLIPQYISKNLDLGTFLFGEHIIREKAMRAYYLSLIKGVIYNDDRSIDTRKFFKYCINVIKINLIEKGIIVRTSEELIFELEKSKHSSSQVIIDILLKIPDISYADVCIIGKYVINNFM